MTQDTEAYIETQIRIVVSNSTWELRGKHDLGAIENNVKVATRYIMNHIERHYQPLPSIPEFP